jgi:hypothetical protein
MHRTVLPLVNRLYLGVEAVAAELATAGMVELPLEALGPQLARFLPDSWDQEVCRAQGGR